MLLSLSIQYSLSIKDIQADIQADIQTHIQNESLGGRPKLFCMGVFYIERLVSRASIAISLTP